MTEVPIKRGTARRLGLALPVRIVEHRLDACQLPSIRLAWGDTIHTYLDQSAGVDTP